MFTSLAALTCSKFGLQLFIGLAGKLMGSQAVSRIIPPGIKHATDLPQHLQEAGFADVTSIIYSHPMQFDMADLVELLVGPHSQFGGMLDKLKAGGRSNIYQEAQQVWLCFNIKSHN